MKPRCSFSPPSPWCWRAVPSRLPEGATAQRGPRAKPGMWSCAPRACRCALELPGRTTAFETSEVRPQVSGIIQERLFTEGAVVKAGDAALPHRPPPLRSGVEPGACGSGERAGDSRMPPRPAPSVLGELAKSERRQPAGSAGCAGNRRRGRSRPPRKAHAPVVAAAEINLKFTQVSAPITGRIGRSVVTTGALVSAAQAEPLTTIQRLDPDLRGHPAVERALLAFRRQVAGGGLARASTEVNLRLEDGSRYRARGRAAVRRVRGGHEHRDA